MRATTTQTVESARLTLKIWHPNCWTLKVTDETDASLLAHTVYNATDGRVKGHFTAYGTTLADVEALINATQNSSLTDSVVVMQRRHGFDGSTIGRNKACRELFVEYSPTNTISDALASEGFIQESPVRVRNGMEYWSVFVRDGDRDRLRDRLDRLREAEDANITVRRITTGECFTTDSTDRLPLLTERQREVFELACEYGYYSWPRNVTTRELAEHAGISKTTLLGHLRKAESKLLDPAIEAVS
ncbi:helix-turn-helix domain-containing protein [Halalkalirubrum salinum]|uniref:helix-turn-helix domain-containing protein n=1 Tax=Halalkalirubrum salinum TaxID=2563889 RepID=UPI0010FB1F42|nr:helix-turn-helix domain-containing protein [Halalkalirubrum salinum]